MPIEFKQATLPNGLQIVAELNDAAHTAAVGFFVKAGSRDEARDLMGVSHFLEHMVFKGTPRRTADDVNREFDDIGADYNASTSQEVTTYYAHVLPEHLGRAIDLLTDILRPSLRTEDFEMEKQVILEEIGMYADRPFWQAYERVMEAYFGPHPLGYRILGTNDTVGSLTSEQMRAYFEHRYSPDNIAVSLAGRLDFDRCVEQITAACGNWPPTGAQRDYRPAEPRVDQHTLRKQSARMHYLIGLCPGPSSQGEQRYAAAVLSYVLGDDDGSRLYWKLVDPGLAEEAELSHHGYDRAGAFMYYASCHPDRAAEVEAAFDEVLDAAADDLTDEEVQRAVSKMAMDLILRSERPAGRMMALGGQWLYLGRYLPLEEELARIESVGVGDLRALLDAYPLRPRTLVRLTPDESAAAAPAAHPRG